MLLDVDKRIGRPEINPEIVGGHAEEASEHADINRRKNWVSNPHNGIGLVAGIRQPATPSSTEPAQKKSKQLHSIALNTVF